MRLQKLFLLRLIFSLIVYKFLYALVFSLSLFSKHKIRPDYISLFFFFSLVQAIILFFKQLLQFFFTWENCLIFAGKYLRIIFRKSHFYNSIIFIFTQHNSDCWIFILQLDFSVIIVHIHLHLTNVLMFRFSNFQIKKNETSQQTIIKD